MVHVATLSEVEAEELGPLIRQTAAVVTELMSPEQVYVTLWSHAEGVPGHIHWVVQPVTRAQMEELEDYGPRLQVKMFEAGHVPDPAAIDDFAERARRLFHDAGGGS